MVLYFWYRICYYIFKRKYICKGDLIWVQILDGKDGTYYNSWDEKRKADIKWEQQEIQNRELKRANELSEKNLQAQKEFAEKQHKIDEERTRAIEKQNKIEEERLRIEEERRNEEIEEERRKRFLDDFGNYVLPIMEMSTQIKDPVEYYKKITELYNSKPLEPLKKQKYEKIRKNINIENLNIYDVLSSYEIPEIYDEIDNLHDKAYELKYKDYSEYGISNFLSATIFCTIVIIIALWFNNTFKGTADIPTISIIVIVICVILIIKSFFTFIESNKLSKKHTEKINNTNKEIKDTIIQINEKIDTLNKKIDEENKELFNKYLIEVEKWENKIKNFEERRIKNFDYPLELALENFSELEIKFGYSDKARYTLRYNDYPKDYAQYKEDFYRQASELKAKESGTEIFENLDNSDMNDISESEQENYITFNKTIEQFCEDFNEAFVACYEKFDLSYIEEEKRKINNIDLFKLNSSDFGIYEYNKLEDYYHFVKDDFEVKLLVNNINKYITFAYISYERDIEKETDEIGKRLNIPLIMALTNKNIADAVAVYKEKLNHDDYTMCKEDIYYELNFDDDSLIISAANRENNLQ